MSCRLASIVTFAVLVPALSGPAAAERPGRAPLADRYVTAMRSLAVFAADVELGDPDSISATPIAARLCFARPNRYSLAITPRAGGAETVVSDGKTLRLWTGTHAAEQPAPAALEALDLTLPRATKEFWALALLTIPEMVATLRDLHEEKGEVIDGAQTVKLRGKLTYGDDPGELKLWLDESSGRPRRIAFSHGKRTMTWRLRETDGAACAYDARPPAGLAAMPRDAQWPSIAIGAPAPDFALTTLGGRRISLSSQRGRAVLLEFWAPWCPGCRLAASTVSKVLAEAQPRGVRALLISTTAERWQLADYLQEHASTGTALHDPAEQESAVGYARYGITGFPSFVVVDRQGRVAAAWKGYYAGSFEVRLRAALNAALAPAARTRVAARPLSGASPAVTRGSAPAMRRRPAAALLPR